ncbi:MAG: peptidylprolyl isomerase [Bacilli bacterium]|nr:peptidylprolyl isomerase [Bacilli bacterium]
MKNKILMSVGITLGAVVLLTGCGSAKLKDGSEMAFKVNGKKVSSEKVYKLLKEKYAKNLMADEIDKIIFDTIYKDDEEIKSQVEEQLEYYKTQYGDSWETTLKSAGYEDESVFEDELRLSFQRNKAVKDYIKENVTEHEINSYYKDEYAGSISAKHILISTSNGRSEEEAEKEAKEIIKRLDKGEDFSEIAKEKSDDPGSKDSGGDLGYFGKGEMVKEFEDAAYALNVDEYTKEPVKTSYGYHIILKTGQKDKAELKDVKDTIIDKIVEKKINEDKLIAVTALEKIRKDYGLKINDSILKREYKEYIQEQKDYYNEQ